MTARRDPDHELQALESEIDLVRGNLTVVRNLGDARAVRALEERLDELLVEYERAIREAAMTKVRPG